MPSAESGFGSRALAGLLLVAVLNLGVGACGRRGQPEPPVDPSAPKTTAPAKTSATRTRQDASADAAASPTTLATRPSALTSISPDADDDEDALADDVNKGVSPQPTPSTRKRTRPYVVPKEPFFLDPLL